MAVELIRQVHEAAACQLYDGQRGRGLRVLRQQAGGGGVSRVRREPPQRRVHRPADAGPPGGAGEDRPQGHRRGPVPARHAPEAAGRGPERRGGGLRQRRGRGREHRLRQPCCGRVSGLNATTAKNVVAYREENGAFTSRTPAAEGAQAGAQGLPAVRRAFCGCRRASPCWTTPPSIRRATPRPRDCWT